VNKKPLRPCPVCSGTQSAEILHRQSFILPQGHILEKAREYDLVSCNTCGFVYADTTLKQKTYNMYYEKMSKYETDYNEIDIGRYTEQAKKISGFLMDKKARIIDIGCGNGGLLLALKKIGYNNLTALDPSTKCIKSIKKQGIAGVIGSIFKNEVNARFDMVILSHVLEHIVDVNVAIKMLIPLLDENGRIYIEVPDASSYNENLVVPFYYFDTEHINHFEEVSLINVGLRNGLRVINIGKKQIDASQSTKYPAIYAVYKKASKTADWKNSAKNSVKDYIKLSFNEKTMKAIIDDLLKKKEEVVIWGAGNYVMRLLHDTGLEKCNIKYFIDKDPKKHGLKLMDIAIYGPEKLQGIQPEITIAICSAVFSGDIFKELKEMNLPNKIVVLK